MATQAHEPTLPPAYRACRYLGAAGDAATHCTFATQVHRCFRAAPPAPVALEQQLRYCLSPAFESCPVFTGAVALPPADPRPVRGRSGWLLGGGLALLLALVAGLSVRVLGSGEAEPSPRPPARDTDVSRAPGTVPVPPIGDGARSLMAESTPTAVPSPAMVPAPAPTPTRYRVRPGDNLTQIAEFFGARLVDLIAVNGLPPDGAIEAGRELIIPTGP